MTPQSQNNTGKLVADLGKSIPNAPKPSDNTPMNAERAARFLDTQKEAFANLVPLSERKKT